MFFLGRKSEAYTHSITKQNIFAMATPVIKDLIDFKYHFPARTRNELDPAYQR